MRTVSLSVAVLLMLAAPLLAQPGGGFGGRGGPGGSGGPGGGFGGRGGDSGGGRMFGGGGFPGGGFQGGGGMSSRGGPPGGSSSRGGPPGGPGGGGFDPAAMLGRFDRNSNGMIDPDENNGFAASMLQRLAERDKSIDLKKPVPLAKLTEAFNQMRGGGGGEEERGGGPSSNEPELLVPDFSLSTAPLPPEGFGTLSSNFSVRVEERDIKEAEDRIRRYDRNNDNKLSKQELAAGRWSEDPMQFDRNKDGVLVASELAVRYANRRIEEEQQRSQGGNRDASGRGGFPGFAARGGEDGGAGRGWDRGGGEEGWNRSGGEDAAQVENRFGEVKSFKIVAGSSSTVSGLPDFFSRSDKDGDGQVMMNEFSSSWNAETLQEFLKWDLNNDGVIVARECLAALENGVRVSSTSSASSGSNSSSSSNSSPSSSSSGSGDSLAAAYVDQARVVIGKYDQNGDGQLTANEWGKMLIKPKEGTDANGDGVITVEEYAAFRAKK